MEEEKKEKKKRTNRKKVEKKEETKKKPIKSNTKSEVKEEKPVIEAKEKHEVKEKASAPEKTDDKFTAVEVIIVMVLALVLGLVLGAFITNNKGKTNSYSGGINPVIDYIEKHYYGTYDKAAYDEQAIANIIATLNDPYAYFIPKEEAATYIEATTGEFIGVGLQIFQNEEGYPEVLAVFDNGPSEKAGIKEKDVIIKVDGENIQNQEIDYVVSKIKNQKLGENVTITIRRDGEEKDIEVTRERVVDPSVTVSYSDKTAIITISRFTENTYKEFLEAYEKVKSEKSKNIIIDLRNNTGDNLESATKIAEMFLDKGDKVYSLEEKSGKFEVKDKKNREIKLNTVILVNQYTSGVSELFVSSLKDNLGLTVIGETTPGNSTIQTLYGLEDGSFIRFTTAKWFTPKGESVDGKGVTIDIKASGTEDYDMNNDHAFVKALEVLKENSI